jgi:hypothetical protein
MWVDVGIVVGWRLGLAQRVGGVARAAYIPSILLHYQYKSDLFTLVAVV